MNAGSNLDNYNWSNFNGNTWFICMNDKDNEAYYSICESENRDNNYKRVKDGMRSLKAKVGCVSDNTPLESTK